MPDEHSTRNDVTRFAQMATGFISVGGSTQTCWFCSGDGHILTAAHIFFRREEGQWIANYERDTEYPVSFNSLDSKKLSAILVEEPTLHRNPYLDFAVLRLTDDSVSPKRFIPLCSNERCRRVGNGLLFCGYRSALSESWTTEAGELTSGGPDPHKPAYLQVKRQNDSSLSGFSGAAACEVCEVTGGVAAVGLLSAELTDAEENIFIVPAARMVAESSTLQNLFDPYHWASTESRLGLLRELSSALQEKVDSWRAPDEALCEVFPKDIYECIVPGVTCTECGECIFGYFDRFPNPKKLIYKIEHSERNVIVLYGAHMSGKTTSGTSLYVAQARGAYDKPVGVDIAITDLENSQFTSSILESLRAQYQDDEHFYWAFLDKLLLAILRDAMVQLDKINGTFGRMTDTQQLNWCERQLKNQLNTIGNGQDTAAGNLVLGLKIVLASIDDTLLKRGQDKRVVIYIDNAHCLDDALSREFDTNSSLREQYQPVNEMLTQRSQQEYDTRRRVELNNRINGRHIVLATQHVPSIIQSTSPSNLSHQVAAIAMRDVATIDGSLIRGCLESRGMKGNIVREWEAEATMIERFTAGHPWFVHRILVALDCMCRNWPDMPTMKLARMVVACKALWVFDNLLKDVRRFIEELNSEIDCLEQDSEYEPEWNEMNDFALSILQDFPAPLTSEIRPAELISPRELSKLRRTPTSSLLTQSLALSEEMSSGDTMALALNAIRNGLLTEYKPWRYSNKIVEMHFKPIQSTPEQIRVSNTQQG